MMSEHYSFTADLDACLDEQKDVDILDGLAELFPDESFPSAESFDDLAPFAPLIRGTSTSSTTSNSNDALGAIFGDDDNMFETGSMFEADWAADDESENVPFHPNAAPIAKAETAPFTACSPRFAATPPPAPLAPASTSMPVPPPPFGFGLVQGRPSSMYTPPTRHGAPVLVKLSRPVLIEDGPVVPLAAAFAVGSSSSLDWNKKLSPEQRCKHKGWAAKKRKRVHYGTSYVYENKANIARKRKREDGKFETRKMREAQRIAEAQAAAATK